MFNINSKVLIKTNDSLFYAGEVNILDLHNAKKDINGRIYEVNMKYNKHTNVEYVKTLKDNVPYTLYFLYGNENPIKRSNSKLKIYNDFIFILETGPTEELTKEELAYIEDNIDPMGDQDDLVDPELSEDNCEDVDE